MIKHLLDRYEQMSTKIKASIWFLICSFMQRGISVITVPVFTRLLNPSEYGEIGVFSSWYDIVYVFVSLNLAMGVYTQGMIKYEDDRKNYVSSFQGLNIALFLFWSILFFPLGSILSSLLDMKKTYLFIMIIMSWINSAFGMWAAECRVKYDYVRLVIVTLIHSVVSPIVGILFVLYFPDKVFGKILGGLIASLVIYILPILSQFRNGGNIIEVKYWIYALKFNIPLIPHYLSQIILNSSDRIMISKYVGEDFAGKYTLAYSVSLIMIIFNTALLHTIHPWLYQRIKDNKIEEIKTVVYPALLIIALVNLVLIAFAPEIIMVFAPSDYYEARWVVPPVAMSVFFMFAYGLFADFEFYYDKAYLASVASIIGAMLNILLNMIFIPRFGYLAAGYTTLFCYLMFAIGHYIIMQLLCNKILDGVRPYSSKVLLAIVGFFLGVGHIFMLSYKNIYMRYSFMAFFVALLIIFRNKLIQIFVKIKSIKENGK